MVRGCAVLSPMVVMSTQRGRGLCISAALRMFAKATDIIGHGPPGSIPRQLTTASAPACQCGEWTHDVSRYW